MRCQDATFPLSWWKHNPTFHSEVCDVARQYVQNLHHVEITYHCLCFCKLQLTIFLNCCDHMFEDKGEWKFFWWYFKPHNQIAGTVDIFWGGLGSNFILYSSKFDSYLHGKVYTGISLCLYSKSFELANSTVLHSYQWGNGASECSGWRAKNFVHGQHYSYTECSGLVTFEGGGGGATTAPSNSLKLLVTLILRKDTHLSQPWPCIMYLSFNHEDKAWPWQAKKWQCNNPRV